MEHKLFFDVMSITINVFTKKMYPAATVIKKTVENFCLYQFRNSAEFFYFVMFPRRQGQGIFIQYINNICKSTVN